MLFRGRDQRGFDTDQSYAGNLDRANRIAIVVFSLLLAIVLVLMSIAQSQAEPGDTYPSEIRVKLTHANAPAGYRLAPTTLVVSGQYSHRPAQCPRRYCGCDLSIEIFGRADPKLFPAANWFRFPRAQPAPGMVAVRQHHVMRLIAHVDGKNWRVRDPNSGGGLTREHIRSIAGFVIVNPHARMAER